MILNFILKFQKFKQPPKHFLNYSIFKTKYLHTNLKHPFHYINETKW